MNEKQIQTLLTVGILGFAGYIIYYKTKLYKNQSGTKRSGFVCNDGTFVKRDCSGHGGTAYGVIKGMRFRTSMYNDGGALANIM